eukprot:3823617-Pleurochrysis_carterae.AAC.1
MLETLHQNRSASSYYNKELGSPRSHHTCHDRTGRANGNGEQWSDTLGQIWRPRNYQFQFGGIT